MGSAFEILPAFFAWINDVVFADSLSRRKGVAKITASQYSSESLDIASCRL